MKKITNITNVKLLGLSLATSLILASGITVQAAISCDFNKDGVLDIKDLAILKTNLLLKTTDVKYDINGDGKVNIIDYTMLKNIIVAQSIPDNQNITSKFTDANFKTEIYKLIGKTSSEPILYSDVKNITRLEVAFKHISSLSGIEHFTALTYLYCDFNELSVLDVSKNTALTNLYCSNNQIAILDLSKNTALTELCCGGNSMAVLDVSKNTALTYLYCDHNELTSLDVSNNTALTYLSCNWNRIAILDVSKNTKLTLANLHCDVQLL